VTTRRRQWAAFVIVVALIGGLSLDRIDDPRLGEAPAVATTAQVRSDVVDTSWFCPFGQWPNAGLTAGVVRLANIGPSDRRAVVRTFSAGGDSKQTGVDIPAAGAVEVPLEGLLGGTAGGAVVDVDGGGVAVEHRVDGQGGRTTAPCHSDTANEWHLAAGITEVGTHLRLALLNPFPAPAIADLTFATDEGAATPRSLTALVVPPRSTVFVDVADHVRRRARVSVSIRLRSGRLAVDRVLDLAGAGRRGTALAPAVAHPASRWHFAEGFTGPGVAERLYVYNPSDEEVAVDVEVRPDGEATDVEPFELTVPPADTVVLDLSAAERVPPGAHSIIVESFGDTTVIAEREVAATDPSSRRGVGLAIGAAQPARIWVLVDGRANEGTDQWLVIANGADSGVTARVEALVGGSRLALDGLSEVAVEPRGRTAIRVGDHIRRDQLTLVVTASGPVVVERDLYAVEGIGMSTVLGIPDFGV